MASGFEDKHGWIASFKPLYGAPRKRRRVRIPKSHLLEPNTKRSADAYAVECERYCRILEGAPTVGDIRHAIDLGAVSRGQGDGLLGPDSHLVGLSGLEAVSLMEAAKEHPSTQREQRAAPSEYGRHERELFEFVAFSKIEHLHELTLARAMGWVEYLKDKGYTWDGRRHRLLWLRRAAQMATTHGLPNVLGGFRIDRNDSIQEVAVWTFRELCQTAATLEVEKDPRIRAVLALGGFVGLRSSEICRIQIGDIYEGVLKVGVRERKNTYSRRDVPLPGIVTAWLSPLSDRPEGHPLVAPLTGHGRMKPTEMNCATFGRWATRTLGDVTGKALPAKCLRKSFSEWAADENLPQRDVDAFMGHQTGAVNLVRARHYLARRRLDDLRKTAAKMDRIIRKGLRQVSTQ
jgi:integrase